MDVNEPVRNRRLQRVQLPGEDDPTVVDDDDVFTEVLNKVKLVAGEQHRRSIRGHLSEQLSHDRHRDRIETGERFVQHEK